MFLYPLPATDGFKVEHHAERGMYTPTVWAHLRSFVSAPFYVF